MQERLRNGRARVAAKRRPDPAPWWMWAALAGGLLATAPAWAQAPTVPEQVQPRAVPPGTGGDRGATVPGGDPGRGASPPGNDTPGLAPGEGAPGSGVPNSGVVRPPVLGAPGAVIRPPATGTMPVIPPPGTPGGDRTVVPK